MFYRIIAAFFIGLVCFSANAQQKEQRVALVIGNSSYKSSPLKNPVNDARDMANSLRGYGFTVIERTNLTTRQVGQTLREFRSKLTSGSVAVVFYAGHGVQIKGENYLPTVDAEINGEEDVPMQSLSTRQVMDVLSEAKTRMNLVFLDACRDNPYARSFRSGSRGIAKENAPSGTLISFATRPGSVAGDGDGRNGLYTSVLLEQIKQSNQPIEQVLKRVVSGVKVASKGQQEPWMEGSIEGDFCFGSCGTIRLTLPVSVAVEMSDEQKEEKFWNDAFSIGTTMSIEAYLERYPNGNFSKLAKARLQNFKNQTTSTSVLGSDSEFNSAKPVVNRSARYGFINTEQLFRLLGLGKKPNEKELDLINLQLRKFAEIYNIKLILQEAVFTSESSDITRIFYQSYQSKFVDPSALNRLPMLGSFSIGYVNTDRFFKNSELSKRSAQKLKDEFKSRESELSGPFAKMSADYDQKKRQFDEDLDKRKKQESAKVLDIANQAIKEISKTDGIDLVLQKAIYIAPEFDITDKVISVVK
jgi:Skp family chaperone for outer membrane proteins